MLFRSVSFPAANVGRRRRTLRKLLLEVVDALVEAVEVGLGGSLSGGRLRERRGVSTCKRVPVFAQGTHELLEGFGEVVLESVDLLVEVVDRGLRTGAVVRNCESDVSEDSWVGQRKKRTNRWRG